jgi:hypothetical protein
MLEKLTQRRPVLTATALYALVVSLAFWRFWAGGFLVNYRSDMLRGYPARAFAAEYMKSQGAFPDWDPHIFGGMPFLANTAHGDTFYPTFLLRLVFPVDIGISLGFLLHIVLAGTFMFMFLRTLKLEWGASFVGGAAYMFTGQVVSMVSPGHDGKLFVSALLPLALLFLYQAVTRGDWRRYLGFGVVVGFALLSPHFQMTYYLLMAAGFFWAYLVFLHPPEQTTTVPWWRHALLFGAGLGVAFAFAAIQLVPFQAYIPFTPRGEGGTSRGWEHAISWSMPPEELLNVVWASFSGILEAYWGRNPFKLHSEYIGAAALILACFAFRLEGRRRLAGFFVFLGVYGVLFALGGYTPFYHLPYALLPGIKLTRAPSSIFVVASFAAAALAAMGTQALLSPTAATIKRTPLIAWAVALGLGVLLAASGFWTGMMRDLAPNPASVTANVSVFTLDSLRAFVVGGIVIGLIWQRLAGRLGGPAWGAILGGVVLLDLWSVERHYIRFSPRPATAVAGDQLLARLRADSGVFRIVPGANYMSLGGVRSVMGYSGTELHRYDELLGRSGDDRQYLFAPPIWRLLGVRYVVSPDTINAPALELVENRRLSTWDSPFSGRPDSLYLYRFRQAEPFAFLVPMAVRVADDQHVPVMLDSRFDPRRYLLVPDDASVGETAVNRLPDPITTAVTVTPVRPGLYRAELAEPAPAGSFLFLSENWHPGWSATVDGRPATVLRAQHTLIGVPLAAGARLVELVFRDPKYPLGRAITLGTLLLLVAVAGQGWWGRRRG